MYQILILVWWINRIKINYPTCKWPNQLAHVVHLSREVEVVEPHVPDGHLGGGPAEGIVGADELPARPHRDDVGNTSPALSSSVSRASRSSSRFSTLFDRS